MLPDPEELRMPPATVADLLAKRGQPKRPLRHRSDGEFLCGPIPLSWLSPAARLPGRVPSLALALWFESGRAKSRRVRLTGPILERFGVGRKALYYGLRVLEAAGLVSVTRELGKNPIVEILDAPEAGATGLKSPAPD